MRMSLIFLIIGASLSAGCATQAPESPWAAATTETGAATAALDCGSFPAPTRATEAEIAYDQAGVNELEVYRVCAEANEANVDEHAAQIGELKISRKALVEAGQAQRNIATMRAEMLEDERKHNFWTSIGYWIVILGMGAAL